jgi:hypothetical protein
MFTANYYTMILDTIIDLQNRGFTSEFSLLGNRLFCPQTKSFFSADQFDVIEIYGFDDEHSEKEETIVYAIECFANSIKGILCQNNSNHQAVLVTKLHKFWK